MAALIGVGAAVAVAPGSVYAATTFVVNRRGDAPDLNLANAICDVSTNTGKQCTLRAAIQEANDTPGDDIINFNITTASKVIAPTSPLPAITGTVTVNGYSQSGAVVNTQAVGNNAVLKIVLDGVNAGIDANGLEMAGYKITVKGLVIQRFDGSGILVSGTKSDVQGNRIGTNAAGTAARGNGFGVMVTGNQNSVGGGPSGNRNLISGNDVDGVRISGSDAGYNVVGGNYLGTNAAGSAALGNGSAGVFIQSAPGNRVGGTSADARNVISGNGNRGITVDASEGTVVQGNLIGTKADGTGDLGNDSHGVVVAGANGFIGGTVSGAGNVVSGNGEGGVVIFGSSSTGNEIYGNVIRLNDGDGLRLSSGPNRAAANLIFQNGGHGIRILGNTAGARLTANQVYANGGLGIDLGLGIQNAAGVTANDVDDPDSGPNGLQNFPVLTSAIRSNASGGTTVAGTLNSNPSTEFRIDLFAAIADPSNHGEAHVLLATTTITTNAGGDRGFSIPVANLGLGQVLTATATSVAAGNTSEFSANVPVTAGP